MDDLDGRQWWCWCRVGGGECGGGRPRRKNNRWRPWGGGGESGRERAWRGRWGGVELQVETWFVCLTLKRIRRMVFKTTEWVVAMGSRWHPRSLVQQSPQPPDLAVPPICPPIAFREHSQSGFRVSPRRMPCASEIRQKRHPSE